MLGVDATTKQRSTLAVVLVALLVARRRYGPNVDDASRALVEREVANGYSLDPNATPATLGAAERSRYALVANAAYRDVDLVDGAWLGVVKGGAAWPAGAGPERPRSEWAVWAVGELLSAAECAAWMKRAEEGDALETGDFIFAGGSWGLSRLHTGARRHSATRMVEDDAFASLMESRLAGRVPAELADGRTYGGVGRSFLVSRYEKGQYFAPHFDGRGSGGYNREAATSSEYTVVLYLSDGFAGGETHYLAGQGSEVAEDVALKPPRGHAVVHRQGTVLHGGGEVLAGTKYIMQFFLYYTASLEPEPRHMTNLRWGA